MHILLCNVNVHALQHNYLVIAGTFWLEESMSGVFQEVGPSVAILLPHFTVPEVL